MPMLLGNMKAREVMKLIMRYGWSLIRMKAIIGINVIGPNAAS